MRCLVSFCEPAIASHTKFAMASARDHKSRCSLIAALAPSVVNAEESGLPMDHSKLTPAVSKVVSVSFASAADDASTTTAFATDEHDGGGVARPSYIKGEPTAEPAAGAGRAGTLVVDGLFF